MCGCELLVRRRGRRPHYCSPRCRQAAYRQRKATFSLEPLPELEAVPLPPIKMAGTDEQVVQAIAEARSVTGALLRLGTAARPQFAWRCAKAGAELREALEKYFPFG
jgi:hypothetical protein